MLSEIIAQFILYSTGHRFIPSDYLQNKTHPFLRDADQTHDDLTERPRWLRNNPRLVAPEERAGHSRVWEAH